MKPYGGSTWLGPVFYAWGSSPYLDWYFETHYIHLRGRSQ